MAGLRETALDLGLELHSVSLQEELEEEQRTKKSPMNPTGAFQSETKGERKKRGREKVLCICV